MLSGFLVLHIPDGFLTVPVSLFGWVLTLVLLGLALSKTKEQFGDKQVPVMGLLAAFIFAAQALNFPVAGGTSGHLMGSALAGILMGPWAGTLIMTAVVVVQGVMFQDGGLLSMGWNIFNMAILAVLSGFVCNALVERIFGKGQKRFRLGAFVAGWVSVELAAVATALQLAFSGTFPLKLSLIALTGAYALVGLGEGLVTAAALAFLQASRPEVLQNGHYSPGRRTATVVTAGICLALVLVLLSPLASQAPDGLESVAEMDGFGASASAPAFEIYPDYVVPGLSNINYSTIVAMLVGTVLVFSLVLILGQMMTRSED